VADEICTQDEIFAMVGKHITESCMAGTPSFCRLRMPSLMADDLSSGYNGSIFAYGQTGSGKTHTIQGRSGVPLCSSPPLFLQEKSLSHSLWGFLLLLLATGAMSPSGEFLPKMKGLIPRVLDHMYFLIAQSEKMVGPLVPPPPISLNGPSSFHHATEPRLGSV